MEPLDYLQYQTVFRVGGANDDWWREDPRWHYTLGHWRWEYVYVEKISFEEDRSNGAQRILLIICAGDERGGGIFEILIDVGRGVIESVEDDFGEDFVNEMKDAMVAYGLDLMPFVRLWSKVPRNLIKDVTPLPEQGSVEDILLGLL